MLKRFIKWLAKILGISFEAPFEIVDNLDSFVKDKLNSMLKNVQSLDIATGYFQISGWQTFAESIESLLSTGGKIRLLIGDVSRENLLPQTAKFLLRLIENPQIEAKTIKPRLLHAKVFMAKTEKELRLLFGSSNITIGGMEANVELNTYEVLDLDSEKAKSFIQWYEKLWESAVPIDEELKLEITLGGQKREKPEIPQLAKDPNRALFLSLLVKDLARVDLRDVGNFAPLKFQYVDAVVGVNRFFFQPGGKRGLMFAHEVGLGKTIISGMILKHLLFNRYIKNALIITPLSIVRQWMEDLRNKFNIEPIEVTSRRIKNLYPLDFNVYVISYDLLREHINVFHKNWDLIIIDESHFIRNNQTLRFKAVKELKSTFYILLTATPMHNRVEDIATQLYLFVPEEIISKATKKEISKVDRTKLFRTFIKRRLQKDELREIIPERKVLPPEIVFLTDEEKNIYEKLKDFLSQESKYYQIISRSIEHIAPFIKQRYLEEFISSKEAILFALENLKKRIEEAINTSVIEYNFGVLRKETEGVIADEIRSFVEDELESQSGIETLRDEEGNLIVRLSIDEKVREGLKTDCSFLDELIKAIQRIGQFSKVKRVTELIEKLKPSEEKKIVVFVSFVKTGEVISKILEDKGIKSGFFHGELEEAQREKLIQKLWSKEKDRIDVLVSTDAAYVGLNLQVADTIIHHDLSWNPMVVEQRIGRIHRIGQKRPIVSYSFLCKDTIDKRKHEILTNKLEEISTHLGISYSVVLSEVAVSKEIEKIMAQFELKEIDEKVLEEKLKQHITDRKEIFELLEELPYEETEILQVGFTNNLINEVENIVGEILRMSKDVINLKIQPIMENENFFVISYQKDGKTVSELSTLNEKAMLNIDFESFKRWKEKYNFENRNPCYISPFHDIVDKVSNLWIEQNIGKFFKKRINTEHFVCLYALLPLKIKNLTADVEVFMNILVPVIYEPKSKEIKIDAQKVYKFSITTGAIEDITANDEALIEEATKVLYSKIDDVKSKVRSDIEKVKVEIEELALQKQRAELETKIIEKRRKLESLSREINLKRSSGIRFEKELYEVKKLKEELDNLIQIFEKVPQSGLVVEFEQLKLIGGCIYY